ncbi:disulfide bond formation protein B [Amaricoccus sp.]|uniref:disulfide bond formation protein B n=1 Tax=Amaricoccus sp. TaxID=1872485 RepID=UPI001B4E3EC5|nr:disulfide bond formation protein B [Amaricoccus sp.]MBP7241425.1 disulfide bond formation protein B [Amaricoccus sp.]
MSPLQRAGIGAAAGSALLLAAAFAFQHFGGYAPCHLCILQRWPHAVAVALGLALLVWPRRELAMLGALAMLVGTGIAAYHAGIEQGWWTGPTTCVAPDVAGLTPEQLLQQILNAPVTRCDEIAWSFLGLSMAVWNGLASAVLALLWARAYASSSASQ